MVWLWSRGKQELQLETRYDNDAEDFVLTLTWPDGRQQVERFPDLSAFRTRLLRLENELETERWKNTAHRLWCRAAGRIVGSPDFLLSLRTPPDFCLGLPSRLVDALPFAQCCEHTFDAREPFLGIVAGCRHLAEHTHFNAPKSPRAINAC